MPLPRDPDDGKGGKAPGGGEQPKGPAAEGIALFIGGQRNHPVVIGMDDRRHRPMGLKPGENAQYDDQGQMTILRRTGLFLLSLDDAAAGAERMVSLRHVNKSPQAREKVGNRGSGGNAGSGRAVPLSAEAQAALNKAKADYKHEGDSVNTEVRCTKNRISFFAGSREVGYYDVEQDTWFFTAKVIHNQATEQVKDEAPRIDHN
jgi:hypothetical protein